MPRRKRGDSVLNILSRCPLGSENALFVVDIWQGCDGWSLPCVKQAVRVLLKQGLLKRRIVERTGFGPPAAWAYWRESVTHDY